MNGSLTNQLHPSHRDFLPILVLTALLSLPRALPAEVAAAQVSAAQVAADYERDQEWRFAREPFEVPPKGTTWRLDDTLWELRSGRVWLGEPDSRGRPTAMVFTGEGRCSMPVADPVELAQLRRFTLEPDLENLELSFDSLVLRAAGDLPPGIFPEAEPSAYAVHKLARDRHQHWLKIRRYDAAAQTAAIGLLPGATLLRVDMKTREHGWLTYEYDSRRMEEIRLDKFQAKNSFVEHWLSLDRAEDRTPTGRPGDHWRPIVDLEHVELKARLTEPGKDPPQGLAAAQSFVGEFDVTLHLTGLADGARALPLYLHPLAKVTDVRDGDGVELPFLRDHIGGRSSAIDKRVHDMSLVVLLDRPIAAGEPRRITVHYEMELAGYARGRYWYPSTGWLDAGLRDRHTALLELTVRESYSVLSMGNLVETRKESGVGTSVWSLERPVKMMTFSMAKKVYRHTTEPVGLPVITTFGSLDGYLSRNRIERVADDVAASLEFYYDLFGAGLPAEALLATLIPASHGQAFDGFLHIGDLSTVQTRTGVMERFRAHEVAHQWWGAEVGWVSYRDQWLSESLAEYSAMMFLEATQENGEQLFSEMLQVYADELNGSLKSTFSGFTRPGLPMLNKAAAARVGPVAHGYRCATADAPSAYFSMAYRKGALVLHMLRVVLRDRTGDDQAFIAALRTFLDTHREGEASTRDLEMAIGEQVPDDWSWFFDQWIYRSEIPTYSWSHRVAPAGKEGGHSVELEIRQTEVAEDFRMFVPVVIELPNGLEERHQILVQGPTTRVSLATDGRPRSVEVNPDNAVLARTRHARN